VAFRRWPGWDGAVGERTVSKRDALEDAGGGRVMLRLPATAGPPPHRSKPWRQHSTAARTPQHPPAAKPSWPGLTRPPTPSSPSAVFSPSLGAQCGVACPQFLHGDRARTTEGHRSRSGSTASGYTALRRQSVQALTPVAHRGPPFALRVIISKSANASALGRSPNRPPLISDRPRHQRHFRTDSPRTAESPEPHLRKSR